MERSAVHDRRRNRPRDHRKRPARLSINPYRPVAPDPAWQTPNAVTLARTMYDTRDFAALPLLAGLPEEAGCPADVSDHCRGPGPHVRGCWVVDLVRSVG